MEFGRVLLRIGIAVALMGHHMQQNRLLHIPGGPQQRDQTGKVMAVHGAQIGKAHIFKHSGGQQEPLQPVLQPAGKQVDSISAGQLFHKPAIPLLGIQVIFAGAKPGQMPGHAAHIFADGHFIVVENDNHRFPADGGVVQTLIGHAAGGCTVANEGNDIIILFQQGSCPCHAQGNGHRTGCVSGHKGIRIAFRGLGKAGQAAVLP